MEILCNFCFNKTVGFSLLQSRDSVVSLWAQILALPLTSWVSSPLPASVSSFVNWAYFMDCEMIECAHTYKHLAPCLVWTKWLINIGQLLTASPHPQWRDESLESFRTLPLRNLLLPWWGIQSQWWLDPAESPHLLPQGGAWLPVSGEECPSASTVQQALTGPAGPSLFTCPRVQNTRQHPRTSLWDPGPQ